MKFIIGIIIVVGLSVGGWNLYQYWGNFKSKDETTETSRPANIEVDSAQLKGMPPSWEPMLDAAKKRGAPGLHDFLTTYGKSIADPKLASIELDYVVLVAQSSPGDARTMFAKVKKRVPQNSPVYNRVKQLENTYE